MASGLIRCGPCGQANRVPTAAAGTPRCGKCHQPLPWIADADDTTFSEVAEAARIPVIVDLWAPWCGPCRMVSPALEQLARDLAGQVKLVKVNVDTSPQISRRFGAQAIPTLLVLRRGQVVARQTGAAPLAALRSVGEQGARRRCWLSIAAARLQPRAAEPGLCWCLPAARCCQSGRTAPNTAGPRFRSGIPDSDGSAMDREGLRVVPEAAPGVEEESAQPAEQGALTGTAPSDHGGQRPVIPGRDRRAGDAAPAAARHARAARGRIMALSAGGSPAR